MTRRTNAEANLLYLEAKERFRDFAPMFLIRTAGGFQIWGPSFKWGAHD
jgi:hypothetical protein